MQYITSLKPILLVITISLFSFTNRTSCTTNNKKVNEFNYLVPFIENEIKLNSNSEKLLDDFVTLMVKDSCTEESIIFIYTKTFEEELKKNSFIGVERAKVVVDYFEKKHKLRRNRCFIIDNAPRYLTIKGEPGINLIYRKKGL